MPSSKHCACKTSTIAVLLSTYQGEAYLSDFLNSLVRQTEQDFVLLVRDDGSSDRTKEILNACSLVKGLLVGEHVGVTVSFDLLLRFALEQGYDYFMFADQDDVWLPEKMEKMRERMVQEELSGEPLLVHCDLCVVDAQLELIKPSFWQSRHWRPEKKTFAGYLMQNQVTGCATLWNRPLAELAVPMGAAALMHDWWLALVASCFGRIVALGEPLVLYRQHGGNAVGAGQKNFYSLSVCDAYFRQAKTFLASYENCLPEEKREIVSAFLSLQQKDTKKLALLWKYRFFEQDLKKCLALLWRALR